MTTNDNSPLIPAPFRERYVELMDIIQPFCDAHLNDVTFTLFPDP